jgi:hypothetical protein
MNKFGYFTCGKPFYAGPEMRACHFSRLALGETKGRIAARREGAGPEAFAEHF